MPRSDSPSQEASASAEGYGGQGGELRPLMRGSFETGTKPMTTVETEQKATLAIRVLSILAALAGAYILYWPAYGIYLIVADAGRPLFVPLLFYPVAVLLGGYLAATPFFVFGKYSRYSRRHFIISMPITGLLAAGLLLVFIGNGSDSDFEDEFLNAVYRGEIQRVEEMLSAGENANKHDSYGQTPLILAAYANRAEIAEVLIAHGADVAGTDYEGETALHCAAKKQNVAVAKVLLAHGAPVDAADRNGSTPLLEAVASGPVEMVALLLDHGADANHRDKGGWRPLHKTLYATGLKPEVRDGIVVALLEHGADPNALNTEDREGRPMDTAVSEDYNVSDTPLDIAERYGYWKIASLLRHHGAE